MAKSMIAGGRTGSADDAQREDYALAPRLIWFAGLCAWVFVMGSLLSYSPGDAPGVAVAPLSSGENLSNWCRAYGAWTAHEAFTMLGSGAWIIALAAGGALAHIAFRGPISQPVLRALGVALIALTLSGFHALLMPGVTRMPQGAGGLIAGVGVHELVERFGGLGTALWLVLLGLTGAVVAFDHLVLAVPRALVRALGPASARAGVGLGRTGWSLMRGLTHRVAQRIAPRRNDVDDDEDLKKVVGEIEGKPGKKARKTAAEAEPQDEAADAEADEQDVESARPARKRGSAKVAEVEDADEDADDQGDEVTADDDLDGEADEGEEPDDAPREFDPEELRAKIAKLPVRFASANKKVATQEDLDLLRLARQGEAEDKYVFPGLDLLEPPEANFSQAMEAYVREQAEALESALRTYRIDGEVAGIDSGPVITLYQVRLAPGTKVSSITSVSSDLARALKASNIRIVPNTEGLDTVGIEIPNRKKEKVRLRELIANSEVTSKMKLPLFLGKDASGAPLIHDLASMPHLLIAGTTGSGKSVCMNAIIMGFLYTHKPSDLKLVLVDPKMVEMSQFRDIPHLMCPVVTEMGKAAAILEWAVTKMDERYELLAEGGCRDIGSYNAMSWEEKKDRFNPQNEVEEARIPRKLPYMVFVIDELADLMMTNKEVESSIVRIAQKARAVGIHLILATQRPQANVVTGLIKSNMPGRISFKVASAMDSRIVLDQKGGELLLGQGDMLMVTPRSSQAMRAQGTLVDDAEIRRAVRFVREVSTPTYERQLMQMRSGGEAAPEDHEQRMIESAQEDPLFDRAVEIVLESKRGSVSLLQRRLAIGYTRASRLIELMGMAGIVGQHKGSVSREVVISLEEWEAMKQVAQADAAEPEPGENPGDQGRLFKEAAPKPVAPAVPTGAAAGAAIEEPPFDTDDDEVESFTARVGKPAPRADIDEDEQDVDDGDVVDEAEDEADDDDAELVDEADEGDVEEGDDDEYEYEYEYVEVDDEAEEGEDADDDSEEVVDEADDEAPDEPETRGQGRRSSAA